MIPAVDSTQSPPGWHPRDRVEVTSEDRARLQRGCYLNDSIVDFFIKFMEFVLLPEFLPETTPVFFFSSFFFGRLRCSTPIDYAGVQRWTNHAEDLFSKQFVFIPICDSHHWSLIIVTNLNKLSRLFRAWLESKRGTESMDPSEVPTVVYLDSLSPQRGNDFLPVVVSYLAEEWLFRKERLSNPGNHVAESRLALVREFFKKVIRQIKPKPPQQKNEYDCGLYLLRSILNFLRNTDGFRQRCVAFRGRNPIPKDAQLAHAYREGDILELREYIRQVIDNLTEPEVVKQIEKDEAERDDRVASYRERDMKEIDEEIMAAVQADSLRDSLSFPPSESQPAASRQDPSEMNHPGCDDGEAGGAVGAARVFRGPHRLFKAKA